MKDYNLLAASTEYAMVGQDKTDMDDEGSTAVLFGSVNLNHSQEHYKDLVEQETT